MAYAALRSLAQILHQTLNRDYQCLILDEKQQIESLVEIITAIQKDFSSQKITQDEEREIRDSAYIVEDIIESRIIERFRTESAGNEDGSTEKKLVRLNVLEDWIVASSKSAGNEDGSTEKKLVRFDVLEDVASSKSAPSRRSRLEIVGVSGVEKPITFQNIDGIRQLARTFRFKAWFLHSDVLLDDASPYKTRFLHSDVLHDDASPYETWFFHSDVLNLDASPSETRFLHSDVLHDDASPYSNAIWTLERLANHGTEIVIIDPYSMGTSATMEKLRSFGFDTSLFVGAITSEDLRALIANRADDAWFEEPEPSSIDITSGAVRNFFPQISQEYKSPMVMAMAGVDADRCIVVTRDFDHIKVANTAGISSILIANTAGESSILRTRHFDRRFSKPIYGPDVVRHLAATYDAHPTYVLPSFTW